VQFYSGNSNDFILTELLQKAMNELSERDFLSARETFEEICTLYPDNWNARYYYSMTLCSIGDFTEAYEQLSWISLSASESIWLTVAKNGKMLIEQKERDIRKALTALI